MSATSISIGGNGPTVTAAITGSSRFTGRVTSVKGIAVGDEVSAQIVQHGSRLTATAIADPASLPSGQSVP